MAKKKHEKKKEEVKEEEEEDVVELTLNFNKSHVYLLVALVIGFGLGYATHLFTAPTLTGAVVSTGGNTNQLGQRTVMALNSLPDVIASKENVTFVDINEYDNSLYKVTTLWIGNQIPVFITKDGKNLFYSDQNGEVTGDPQSIEGLINAYEKNYELVQAQLEAQSQPQSISKTETPKIELFVMSYCPYGLQAEKAMIPVMELLGNKADIKLMYVNYLMHGWKEAIQNNYQYCIEKNQPEVFTEYMRCFLQEDNHLECANNVEVDLTQVDICIENLEETYNISEIFNSSTQSYPRYPVHTELNELYGIRGSPGLVINGILIDSQRPVLINSKSIYISRSAESFKQLVCEAFVNQPSECNEILNASPEAPGIGPIGVIDNTDSTASCG